MNERIGEGAPRVLLIEDDLSVRRMLRVSLRIAGYEVTEVTTGKEALQLLQLKSTEMAILDLGLPDDGAGAVLQWLRQQEQEHGSSPAPVWVVVSALDQQEAVQRHGFLDGHYVPKPFDPWQLVQKLESLRSP